MNHPTPITQEAPDARSAEMHSALTDSWWNRVLPPPGFERKAFLFLWALIVVLKVMTIIHYRVDSDETQHAHVIWEWTQGRLQYHDFFDNHMPLFQMAFSPFFPLLGQHGYIVIELRAAMIPLFLLCLWAVFELASRLYSPRIGPWATLAAAAYPAFFYTSTEFRPDILWAAFWLIALLVAVSGPFTIKRAFAFGIFLGLTFAVSLKTVVLLAALVTATLVALFLSLILGGRPTLLSARAALARVITALAGALIAPAALVLYFYSRGALWIMYYCVICHNIIPGLKRWGHFSLHQGFYPASLLLLGLYGWLIFRQTPDRQLALKRAIVLLTPWFFLCLLLSYWPDITREDDLPYTPLIPLSLLPLLILAGHWLRAPELRRKLWVYGSPAVCFIELLCVWRLNPLRTDRLKGTSHGIADVLLLTRPADYVEDAKGDYIFRQRPDYWVIETLTKTRIRQGTIRDSIPDKLIRTGTPLCDLFCAHILPETDRFILSNYMPFDHAVLDLGAAGKELGPPAPGGIYSFDIAIPATYAVTSESGITTGTLDNAPYTGPVALAAGHHTFRRLSGTGRVAVLFSRAIEAGFRPLFDASEKFIAEEHSRQK